VGRGGDGRRLQGAPADRGGAGCDAVVARAARDQIAALRLATFDEILARQLECRLDRLRSAADVEDVIEPHWRTRDEVVGKLLGGLRCEEARVRVFKMVELRAHR